MRQLENTLKIKDSSFIYTPEGMYFSELSRYNIKNYLIGNNPNNDSFEEYHLIEDLLDKYKGPKKLIK